MNNNIATEQHKNLDGDRYRLSWHFYEADEENWLEYWSLHLDLREPGSIDWEEIDWETYAFRIDCGPADDPDRAESYIGDFFSYRRDLNPNIITDDTYIED